MKKLLLAAALMVAGPAFADPVDGIWKTAVDDNGKYGHVEIGACGSKICGVLIKSFNGDGTQYDSENIGVNIVEGMTNAGGGEYNGGTAYAPDRDKTYSGKMTLDGDNLVLYGCVLGGLICRGQDWTRVQ